jgi:hypothetical protein
MTVRHGLGILGPASAGVTQPQDERLIWGAVLSAGTGAGPLDATPGIIYGPGSPCNVTGSSSGPNMQYVVAAGAVATARGTASDGLVPLVNDAPVTVNTATPAPGSGSRYDLIWVRSRNANDGFGDANSDPEINFTVGAASSTPSVPATPSGALVLATALVGTSIANASLATITMVAPYKVARGCAIPVRSQAERDALFAFKSLEVKRLDFGGVIQRYDGTQWGMVRSWAATARAGSSDNFSANTRTSLQSLTFTGPPGTYQVVSRLCISSSVGSGAWPGFLWVTAAGVDIVDTARADTNSLQRGSFTTIESFTSAAGGSITVAHAYQLSGAIGTVWNGPSTRLSVSYLGS